MLFGLADLPYIDLVYYVLPMSQLDNFSFIESYNDSIMSNGIHLIRVITLSLEIPRGEEELVRK